MPRPTQHIHEQNNLRTSEPLRMDVRALTVFRDGYHSPPAVNECGLPAATRGVGGMTTAAAAGTSSKTPAVQETPSYRNDNS